MNEFEELLSLEDININLKKSSKLNNITHFITLFKGMLDLNCIEIEESTYHCRVLIKDTNLKNKENIKSNMDKYGSNEVNCLLYVPKSPKCPLFSEVELNKYFCNYKDYTETRSISMDKRYINY